MADNFLERESEKAGRQKYVEVCGYVLLNCRGRDVSIR